MRNRKIAMRYSFSVVSTVICKRESPVQVLEEPEPGVLKEYER